MHLYTFYCWNIKEHMNNQSKVRCVMCILLSRDLCSCRKSTQLTQSSPTISNIDANLSHWLSSSITYSENVSQLCFEAGLAYQLER